jgi:hypothetical protein
MEFTGKDILSSLDDGNKAQLAMLSFTVMCLWYDDIEFRSEAVGYRIFLSPEFFVSNLMHLWWQFFYFLYCFFCHMNIVK